jgi:hypothetical protein
MWRTSGRSTPKAPWSLRVDVEALATAMRRAAEVYLQGVGDARQPNESSVGAIVIVPQRRAQEMEELKREVRSLFRTCAHRFGLDRHAPIPCRSSGR